MKRYVTYPLMYNESLKDITRNRILKFEAVSTEEIKNKKAKLNLLGMPYKYIEKDGVMFVGVGKYCNVYLVGEKVCLGDAIKHPSYKDELLGVFEGLNIAGVDLKTLDTSEVTKFDKLFARCRKMHKLDLSPMNMNKAKSMSEMIYSCSKLEDINFGEKEFNNVETMNSAFYDCWKLIDVDLRCWNFRHCENADITGMFSGCINLERLALKGDLNIRPGWKSPFTLSKKLKEVTLNDKLVDLSEFKDRFKIDSV